MQSNSLLGSFFNLSMQLAIQPLFKTNALCMVRLQREELQGAILQLKELYQTAYGYNSLTIPTHCSFIFSNPHINLVINLQQCVQLLFIWKSFLNSTFFFMEIKSGLLQPKKITFLFILQLPFHTFNVL